MTINRRFLNWGVFFITMGSVVLLAQTALLGDADVAAALRFWPVLVIALGVGLLLRRTRFSVAGGMLAAAMPGLLFGGLIVAAPELPDGCDATLPGPTTLTTRDGTFADRGTVDLRLACGNVTVVMAPGTGWLTETGNGAGDEPIVTFTDGRLQVVSAHREGWQLQGAPDKWRVTLPTETLLDLVGEINAGKGDLDLDGARFDGVDLRINAGDVRIDFGEATVGRLSVDANAARVALTLPEASDLSGDLSVNAGALKVCVPDGLGFRMTAEQALAGITTNGLVRVGDGTWETPDYATAAHRADVSVTANVGSVDINPEGGCK